VAAIDGVKPKLIEFFFDDVFRADSLLDRQVYVKKLARFGKWIFNAQALRDRVQSALIDSFREE
jgi:hypothetical protein